MEQLIQDSFMQRYMRNAYYDLQSGEETGKQLELEDF